MASPLQSFIENYMRLSQMQEQQRQFDENAVLQRRQLENQEVNQFLGIAQRAKNPAELGQVAEFFGQRNPEMSGTFQELMLSIVPTLETQKAATVHGAMGAMDPGQRAQVGQGAAVGAMTGQDIGAFAQSNAVAGLPQFDLTRAARIGSGLELDARGLESAEQFDQNLAQSAEQFRMNYAQNESQFARQQAQRAQEFGVSSNLQRMDLLQRGAQGEMQLMAGAGLLPMMMRGELSREAAGIEQQLQHHVGAPEVRQRLQRRLGELNQSIGTYDNLISSEMSKGGGEGPTIAQLYTARSQAWDDINKAKDTGEKQTAQEAFNQINAMIAQYLGQNQASQLRWDTRFRNESQMYQIPLGGQ